MMHFTRNVKESLKFHLQSHTKGLSASHQRNAKTFTVNKYYRLNREYPKTQVSDDKLFVQCKLLKSVI